MRIFGPKERRNTILLLGIVFFFPHTGVLAQDAPRRFSPPPVPVRVAPVARKSVSERISLVGTTVPVLRSIVAAGIPGLVIRFPVKEGDFVKKGALLAKLRATGRRLRLKAAAASRKAARVKLENAAKALRRLRRLQKTKSIAEERLDDAETAYRMLVNELHQKDAEIELLEDEIRRKEIRAPFSGFVVKAHTQVGQWLPAGGPVVTLIDLSRVRVTVDVPERHYVRLNEKSETFVTLKSLSDSPIPASIEALLSQGDSDARTFPVKVLLDNPGYRIKSAMEAVVTFNLPVKKRMLLVPKDAVVTTGYDRRVYRVVNGKADPVPVRILGYYDGHVAVSGDLKEGQNVVIRGNERLRPGQAVRVQ